MNNTINSQVSFKANFTNEFLDAADSYLRRQKRSEYKQFCSAIRRFAELPNSDSITIRYSKELKNGETVHALYADELGKKPVLLTAKDQFRKVIKKFSFLSEREFKTKTGLQ